MDLKKIQELIKLVKKNDLGELKVKEGEFFISIKNKGGETVYTTTAAPAVCQQQPATEATTQNIKAESAEVLKIETDNEKVITFRSPMVGTFYRKPGMDKDPYVKVGDSVKNGDVLCIIEAMKLFNEIEFDGGEAKIIKILAEDNSPVEYDQPLFLIEKA